MIDERLKALLSLLSVPENNQFLGVQVILGGGTAFDSLRLAKANLDDKKITYDSIVSQFVRSFGRNNLVVEYFEGHRSYEFTITQDGEDLIIIGDHGRPLSVILSRAVYDELCPHDALNNFRACMQSSNRSTVLDFEYFARVSEVCIAKVLHKEIVKTALEKYLKNKVECQHIAEEMSIKTNLALWKFLRCLQHTLLLLDYLSDKFSLKRPSGFSIFCEEHNSNRILLLAAPQLETTTDMQVTLREALNFAIDDLGITAYGGSAIQHKLVGLPCCQTLPVTKGFVDNIFTNKGRQNRARYQLLWGMALAERLSSAIHEGKPLEFYFLIADVTEVGDNAMLSYDPFEKGSDTKLLQPLSLSKLQDGDRKARLMHSTAVLKSEHFPWFANGKHALLWNASSDELIPAGLVKLNTETWASLVRKSYTPKYKLDYQLPSSILTYIPAGGREPGVIGVHNDRSNGVTVTVLKNFARFTTLDYRPAWIETDKDKRNIILRRTIKKTLVRQELKEKQLEELTKELTELAVRAADDPDLGGTLVVVTRPETNLKNLFPLKMGDNWFVPAKVLASGGKVLTSEDKLALLGHDGATLVNLKIKSNEAKWVWSFRHLLMMDISDTLEKIGNWREHYGGKSPFDWVGSRRMSAALSALKCDIDAVIVISQDGDIVLWYAAGNKRICRKLPRASDGSSIRWSLDINGEEQGVPSGSGL